MSYNALRQTSAPHDFTRCSLTKLPPRWWKLPQRPTAWAAIGVSRSSRRVLAGGYKQRVKYAAFTVKFSVFSVFLNHQSDRTADKHRSEREQRGTFDTEAACFLDTIQTFQALFCIHFSQCSALASVFLTRHDFFILSLLSGQRARWPRSAWHLKRSTLELIIEQQGHGAALLNWEL